MCGSGKEKVGQNGRRRRKERRGVKFWGYLTALSISILHSDVR
jgi:hypothetical protein